MAHLNNRSATACREKVAQLQLFHVPDDEVPRSIGQMAWLFPYDIAGMVQPRLAFLHSQVRRSKEEVMVGLAVRRLRGTSLPPHPACRHSKRQAGSAGATISNLFLRVGGAVAAQARCAGGRHG